MKKTIITKAKEETMELGHQLAQLLPPSSTITLTGDLGAGKTTLVRGVAEGLGIKEVVQSPTFNIMKIYYKYAKPLIHIDAYRLADINTDIGLDEYIGYEAGITMIEWPMYIANLLPDGAVNIEILNIGGDNRQITIEAPKEILEAIK